MYLIIRYYKFIVIILGNIYSMENLRREEVRLTFFCYKFGEDGFLSFSE